MVRAERAYCVHGDYDLLRDRVDFLTLCPSIKKVGSNVRVRAGLAKTHPLLTAGVQSSLAGLDRFLDGVVTRLAKRGKLSAAQLGELRRRSFLQGYLRKIPFRTTPDRISQVRRCWRDV